MKMLILLVTAQNKKRKREYEYESGSDSGDEPVPAGDNNGNYEIAMYLCQITILTIHLILLTPSLLLPVSTHFLLSHKGN